MIVDSIQFGSRTIEFGLTFSSRKTLGITITPDMEVLVKAPENTTVEKVREVMKKKAPWIIKQQSFFLAFQPKIPPRKYISGESHLYLGRQYLLKVTLSGENEVKYRGRYIEVLTDDKNNAESLLKEWYRQKAEGKFSEIAKPLINNFKKYQVEPTGLDLRDMPTRWGSCTPNGKIILNPELIKAPRPCIEYVIIHELCHLIHHDHTKKFFDLQTREMPGWERWKGKLENLLA